MEKIIRIAIDGSNVKSGGGIRYLLNLIDSLGESKSVIKIHVLSNEVLTPVLPNHVKISVKNSPNNLIGFLL